MSESTVTPHDLAHILEQHRIWVESDGSDGEKADLTGANLQGADLSGANLQDANLFRADLQGADLSGADLRGVDLDGANLQRAFLSGAVFEGGQVEEVEEAENSDTRGPADHEKTGGSQPAKKLRQVRPANLTRADLRESDLSDAKLSNVIGLLPDKLAGAMLANAKLPADLENFAAGLGQVREISLKAGKVFIALLAACVYCWLTIWTTTDAELLPSATDTALPIIQTRVPIAGFYWAAPAILLAVYLYLHFYLQNMWEALARLPAVFPDGKVLHEKAYPWLLSGLVRGHFVHLREGRSGLSRLQNFVSVILAWWLVPVTLVLIWARYLSRHDWPWTIVHIVLVTLSVAAAMILYRAATRTLKRLEPEKRTVPGPAEWLEPYSAIVAICLMFIGLTGSAIEDAPDNFIPRMLRSNADFVEADVSTKPASWTGTKDVDKAAAELALVKGARLAGRDLRHAHAERAFLAKADLYRANLQGAHLDGANLQGANLLDANLQKANLLDANLQKANLLYANLQGADLDGANLQRANLLGADLQRANLDGADLQRANLLVANLQEATLSRANLQRANLLDANLQKADLYRANLQGAHLPGAKLQGAILTGANLRGANLDGANLQGANLSGAKLREALFLNQTQIDAACYSDTPPTLPEELDPPPPCAESDG